MAEAEKSTAPPSKPKPAAKPKNDAANKDAPKTPRRSKFQEMYPEDSKLEVLVKENPKKEGSKSAERFAHYFSSKTVGDFLHAGGTYADIMYDLPRGRIKITTPDGAVHGG